MGEGVGVGAKGELVEMRVCVGLVRVGMWVYRCMELGVVMVGV